jgi:protein-tyrosine phosphatase
MDRLIALEGCLNFRDLGGYPTADGRRVRWRCLYRSDALHHLTAADVVRLRNELAVSTVIDLRSSAELRSEGRGRLAGEAILFEHLPLFDGEVIRTDSRAAEFTLADRYALLAEYAKERIARVITVLAESPGAAVYHCAAGKDRTGVISAILLGLLGVREDVIVADYAATQASLEAIVERLMSAEGYQTMLAALPPDTLHAEPETMLAFLAHIRDRYGDMPGYARAIGIPDRTLAQLTARLLEQGK